MPHVIWTYAFFIIGLLAGCLATYWYTTYKAPKDLKRILVNFRDMKRRYLRLLQTADLGIVVLDENHRIIEHSTALNRIFPNMRMGDDFIAQYVIPEEVDRVLLELDFNKSSNGPFDLEFPLNVAGDTQRLWRWGARYAVDRHDGSKYLTLIGSDITELRMAHFRLHASEKRFRQVFLSAPVGMALAEVDGRLLTVNQEYARFLGFDNTEALVGRYITEFLPAEDATYLDEVLTSIQRRSLIGFRTEKQFLHQDGNARWGAARGVSIEDEHGQQYLISQLADIHERKNTELALIKSEQLLANLISNISGAVYQYNLNSDATSLIHHDFHFSFISGGIEGLVGYPRSMFMQEHTIFEFGHLIMAEDRPVIESKFFEALRSGSSFQFTYRVRHADSAIRWVSEQGRVVKNKAGDYKIDGLILDVTREHQARESEQVYRRLVADTETGFVALSLMGFVLDANKPFAQMLGYRDVRVMVGQQLQSWSAKGYELSLNSFLQDVVDGVHSRNFESQLITTDGRKISVLINAVATSGIDGERAIKCLVLDISSSKAVQDELNENRNQLEVAQRIARLGAWQWSFEDSTLAMSDIFLELIGHPKDLAAPSLTELQRLIFPEDAIAFKNALGRLVADDQHLSIEFRAAKEDKLIRFFRADAALERNREGRRVRLIGTIQDVTSSKLAEIALRDSEARYRSLFDTNLDAIYFMSLSGHIEECNQAFTRLTGFSHANLLNMTYIDLTPEYWRKIDEEAIEQIKLRGWCEPYNKEFICADQSHVAISSWAWMVFDDEGKPLRIMSVARDITELKRIEAERAQLQKGLQQAQKMEAIGHLTGGIAHDFNNILASILGYTDLALRRKVTQEDERLSNHLNEVKQAGERARELISQMMLFSRGNRSPNTIQPIHGLVIDAVRMLRPTLPTTLQLKTLIPSSLPPVRIESVSLQQIVMNLLINARDAMGGKGDIHVYTDLIEVCSKQCASCSHIVSGHFLELVVKDEGPGISEQVLERIFDPFFSTKAVGKGTGMGLPVVHGIVHDAGGHLLVETGSWGTAFRVLLPIPEEIIVPELKSPEAVAISEGNGEVIVIVDDEEPVANMLGELLLSHGYQVRVYTDSLAALNHLQQHSTEVDILITDLVMPMLDGIELVRKVREFNPRLRVIMLSGQASMVSADSVSWPLLAKPVNVTSLLNCMSQLLSQQGALAPN